MYLLAASLLVPVSRLLKAEIKPYFENIKKF